MVLSREKAALGLLEVDKNSFFINHRIRMLHSAYDYIKAIYSLNLLKRCQAYVSMGSNDSRLKLLQKNNCIYIKHVWAFLLCFLSYTIQQVSYLAFALY